MAIPEAEAGYVGDPSRFTTLRSTLAVPLEGLNGVVGVLAMYRTDRDAFSPDHLRILLAVSSKIALSVENALKYQQAEDSATTDYLTGLPNAAHCSSIFRANWRAAPDRNLACRDGVRPRQLQAD